MVVDKSIELCNGRCSINNILIWSIRQCFSVIIKLLKSRLDILHDIVEKVWTTDITNKLIRFMCNQSYLRVKEETELQLFLFSIRFIKLEIHNMIPMFFWVDKFKEKHAR